VGKELPPRAHPRARRPPREASGHTGCLPSHDRHPLAPKACRLSPYANSQAPTRVTSGQIRCQVDWVDIFSSQKHLHYCLMPFSVAHQSCVWPYQVAARSGLMSSRCISIFMVSLSPLADTVFPTVPGAL